MKIKGIKRGKTIELLEELNIPDGTEILVEIDDTQLMSDEERQEKLKEIPETAWEGREDFVKTMEELDTERHTYNQYNPLVTSNWEFWKSLEKFRKAADLEEAGIESEIFEGVRDTLPGREVVW